MTPEEIAQEAAKYQPRNLDEWLDGLVLASANALRYGRQVGVEPHPDPGSPPTNARVALRQAACMALRGIALLEAEHGDAMAGFESNRPRKGGGL